MARPSENLGEISTGLGDVSGTLGDSAHIVDHMSDETPNKTETATKHKEDALDRASDRNNQSDGDHEVDDWSEKQIGFLAGALLSRVKARKGTEEAKAAASSVSLYSQGGEQGGGGCNSIVRLDVRARIRRNGVSLAGHANENFRTEQKLK
ncbi:hypothetical protein [Phyllobacterium lublinensis]|uniref:hypothetical protein n=1 Tax=Phyllobacterium lublinensis TaxID=2875708 RepID=UPI001CC9B79D|nr:hypothetical protein [Phyllobacterium sp. 2063]MBZ9653519.1 hypothetical protein [Phyllobacterium sp. 2063]